MSNARLSPFLTQITRITSLLPLDKNGNENESGEVYLYRYFEDEEGLPRIENIESDDEYEAAADRFDELLDDEMFDDI